MDRDEYYDKRDKLLDWVNFYFGQGHFGYLSLSQFNDLAVAIQDMMYSFYLDPREPKVKPQKQHRKTFPELENIIQETNRRLKNDRR